MKDYHTDAKSNDRTIHSLRFQLHSAFIVIYPLLKHYYFLNDAQWIRRSLYCIQFPH